MTGFRFVHAADLHLDSPFLGLKTVAPDHVAGRLIEATFVAYERIIDLCIAERVDALLVAGDVYDGADRSLKAQLRFVAGVERLDRAGIRSFVCHGNHDPLDGWQARLRFPASCHQFSHEVEGVPLDPARPDLATVYGISYPQRDVRENLVPKFGAGPREGFSIGLLHCNVGSNPEHAAYSPCTMDDLRQAGIDYWALGHVHMRQVLSDFGPAVVYPGNPQGRHPVETGSRGVYLVDVSGGGDVRLEFHDVSAVRWEAIRIEASGMTTEQDVIDAADAAVDEVRASASGRDIVYSLTLAGRGSIHDRLARPNTIDDLQIALNDRFATSSPFAWCEGIVNNVAREIDRDALARQGDFVGDLLRLLDQAPASEDLQRRLREPLRDLFEHRRAARFLGEPPEIAPLLESVEETVLAELLP